MIFRRLKLWKTQKTIKHFRLKIKTKTKSKMPAKMNTELHGPTSHETLENIYSCKPDQQ